MGWVSTPLPVYRLDGCCGRRPSKPQGGSYMRSKPFLIAAVLLFLLGGCSDFAFSRNNGACYVDDVRVDKVEALIDSLLGGTTTVSLGPLSSFSPEDVFNQSAKEAKAQAEESSRCGFSKKDADPSSPLFSNYQFVMYRGANLSVSSGSPWAWEIDDSRWLTPGEVEIKEKEKELRELRSNLEDDS